MNGIKSRYVNNLACVRGKGESEYFKIDSNVKTRLRHVPLSFQPVYGCSDERSENRNGKQGGEILEGERVDIP